MIPGGPVPVMGGPPPPPGMVPVPVPVGMVPPPPPHGGIVGVPPGAPPPPGGLGNSSVWLHYFSLLIIIIGIAFGSQS